MRPVSSSGPLTSRCTLAVAATIACLVLSGCTQPARAPLHPSTTLAPTLPAPSISTPTSPPPSPTTTTAPFASDLCDGASTGYLGPGAPPTTTPPTSPPTSPPSSSWNQHAVIAGTCPQVLDPALGAGFALVSHVSGDEGPWVLQRIDLGRATTESGPTFSVGSLAAAAGYLWISCGRSSTGDAMGPLLCEVDPRTLAVMRQIQLPPSRAPGPGADALWVADGPGDTVWVGYGQTLVHIATGDGVVLRTVPMASGTVTSVSIDPALQFLYVALSYPFVAGQTVDAAVLEFDARSGHLLAGTPATSAVTDSVAGGALTAVPGGVWMSFRTGMLGETILLRQSDLAVVGPPNSLLNGDAQPDGVFHWIMDASTVYGDGTLFLVNENGVVACIDPRRGVPRAQEHLADALGGTVQLLAVDPASGHVFATDGDGLQVITPPAACRG